MYTRTADALLELASPGGIGFGEHETHEPSVRGSGLVIGYEPFDPARHDTSLINPLAPDMGFGEQHVSVVLPERPLSMAVIIDTSRRRETISIRQTKQRMVRHIGHVLTRELDMGITDQVELHKVRQRDRLAERVGNVALEHDLVFVVSDFSNIELPSLQTPAVAIKANHLIERRMPEMRGRVALGGWLELDTQDIAQRQAYDKAMTALHQKQVTELQAAGYEVAEAVTQPACQYGYSVSAVDKSIARAVTATDKRKR